MTHLELGITAGPPARRQATAAERDTGQRNRAEGQSHILSGQLTYHEGPEKTPWRKDGPLKESCWTITHLYAQTHEKAQQHPQLSPCLASHSEIKEKGTAEL